MGVATPDTAAALASIGENGLVNGPRPRDYFAGRQWPAASSWGRSSPPGSEQRWPVRRSAARPVSPGARRRAASLTPAAAADFLYRDFNSTRGLRFNGDAATSTCEVDSRVRAGARRRGAGC